MLILGNDFKDPLPRFTANGIADPLNAALAVQDLIKAGEELGMTFRVSTDLALLAETRRKLRGSELSPMFDAAVNPNLEDHSFWMSAHDRKDEVIAVQAFRLDEAVPSLAEWVLGWMIVLYARRREMIVPKHPQPPDHSKTLNIRGKVAYHGELWIDKHAKHCMSVFPPLGMLLCLLKWQPEAVWALTGETLATRGHMIRAGYGHIEPNFLTWEWQPMGAELNEWIGIAEKRDLEFLISRMATKRVKYLPSPAP